MKHREYVAAREARDPAFKAAREALRPQYEWKRALIRARIDAGLTQQQLAERLGTQQAAVARWESGRVCPKIDTLCHIAAATGTAFMIGPGDPPVLQCAVGPPTMLWLNQLQSQAAQMQQMVETFTDWTRRANVAVWSDPSDGLQGEEPRAQSVGKQQPAIHP